MFLNIYHYEVLLIVTKLDKVSLWIKNPDILQKTVRKTVKDVRQNTVVKWSGHR